ncbi:hypothetical protein HQ529_06170 [Candidatus Woesearchaeota archaeon]|nr:hypothetical protein [Candidatus Woesearchaeota archaeon]
MKHECVEMLKQLTGKKYVVITKRGNRSIKLSLRKAKELGKKELLIQDQGGWITYRQFGEELGFNITELKTNHGLIENVPKADILIVNSMTGYFAMQDMEKLSKEDIFLINDASGSIGTEQAKFGDIILGSFGRWKPINLESGGFIAMDNKEYLPEDENVELDYTILYNKLKGLGERLEMFNELNKKIKNELKEFEIIDGEGINVVVKFKNDEEKNKIINYCERNKYEYVLCPKEIRVLEYAISIEVKRT